MGSSPETTTFGPRTGRLHYLVIALLGMVFAGSAGAVSPNPKAHAQGDASKTSTMPAANPKTEQQLEAVQQAWVDAEIHRDAAELRRILSPQFIFTFGVGAPESRESFIHAVVTAPATKQTQALSDTTTVIDGDTAVIAGRDTVRGVVHGKPYKAIYCYMATYVRRNGHWIALAEHLAPLPDKK